MLKNMTDGAPLKLIIPFTVPLLIGNVFQQLYNIVDTWVVGRFLGADALAANILDGKTAFVNGVKVTGSMPDNGNATATMDGLTTTSVTIPAGYTSGGTVSLTADIEEALAAI